MIERYRPSLAVATDYDASILPALRAYLASRAVGPGVVVVRADAKCLPFPDATFDLVLALYVLHHVMGYRAALREVARVTRPGGRFAFIEPVRPGWMPAFTRLAPPEGVPTRRELARALAGAGLAVDRWRGLPFLAYVVARKDGGRELSALASAASRMRPTAGGVR